MNYKQDAGPFSKDRAEICVEIALQTIGILRKLIPIDDGPTYKEFVKDFVNSYTQVYRITIDIHNAKRTAQTTYPRESHISYCTSIVLREDAPNSTSIINPAFKKEKVGTRTDNQAPKHVLAIRSFYEPQPVNINGQWFTPTTALQPNNNVLAIECNNQASLKRERPISK
jgi:hypothetical protein